MKKLVREFFFLRKGERWSLFVVACLLLASSLFRLMILTKPVKHPEANTSLLDSMIIMMDSILQAEEIGHLQSLKIRKRSASMQLFEFDPNTVSKSDLVSMNLPGYVASNIISYRKAGASFDQAEDLKCIYGMTDELFDSIRKYIKFEHLISKRDSTAMYYHTVAENGLIELNRADTLALCDLPGIGISFSARIIKYRELLGGYYKVEQLLEVYGLDSARFNGVKTMLFIDTLELHKIDLNKASFKEMIAHPYLDKNSVYALLDYRKYVVEIQSVSELLTQHVLDEGCYRKIYPYLECK